MKYRAIYNKMTFQIWDSVSEHKLRLLQLARGGPGQRRHPARPRRVRREDRQQHEHQVREVRGLGLLPRFRYFYFTFSLD